MSAKRCPVTNSICGGCPPGVCYKQSQAGASLKQSQTNVSDNEIGAYVLDDTNYTATELRVESTFPELRIIPAPGFLEEGMLVPMSAGKERR